MIWIMLFLFQAQDKTGTEFDKLLGDFIKVEPGSFIMGSKEGFRSVRD